jgi:hypothetical protein
MSTIFFHLFVYILCHFIMCKVVSIYQISLGNSSSLYKLISIITCTIIISLKEVLSRGGGNVRYGASKESETPYFLEGCFARTLVTAVPPPPDPVLPGRPSI